VEEDEEDEDISNRSSANTDNPSKEKPWWEKFPQRVLKLRAGNVRGRREEERAARVVARPTPGRARWRFAGRKGVPN
jgi:hypothetical protein